MPPTPENSDATLAQYSEPHPDDKICITGFSGSFPESNSVQQLGENLFNKVDLITDDTRRWKPSNPEIPQRTGKIYNIENFDAGFFNIYYKEAHMMDSMQRILLEKAYECIIDAGYNPAEIRNSKTGVFIGTCYSESLKEMFYNQLHVSEYGNMGAVPGAIGPYISKFLGVTGPSYSVDTACSSSLHAFDHAVKAIRDGLCDSAIVGGANLCLLSIVSHRFYKLGVLSPDGTCRSFDNKANGYARSEAIAACFLQKAKDSRRIYAEVIHTKTNCDGYKEQGITYPSSPVQKQLLVKFYKECGLSPSTLEFMEAHGTGTKIGDPEELNAIDQVFCTGRSEPLLIGSVKSNLGHAEGASGLCCLAKLCIAYNTGFIPPNIHYFTPREGIDALSKGRIQVVTEKRPWGRGLASISNFGFGGANAHVLLRNISREKVNKGIPTDDLPRLVCISGRLESSVATVLDHLESKTVDADEVRLWHAIHERDIANHGFRGYTLLGSTPKKSLSLARSIKAFSGRDRPVYFVYSGLGSQSPAMARQLLKVPVFSAAIQKCHNTLESKGINLTKVLTEPKQALDHMLHSFIEIAAVQIGLTDILKTVGINPNNIIGHDVGELGCAYADGCLSAEQAILAAYSMGQAFVEAKMTGQVPSSGIAYCSRYSSDVAPKILRSLKGVIQSPKTRSEKWISTSVPQASWKEKAILSSAEYHTNTLLRPAVFEEMRHFIPSNAIIIEVAPHGMLQDTLNHFLPKKVTNVALGQKHENGVQFLFTALGKLFEAGLNPHLANIYPHVAFPVAQGTSMLSHLVEWDHSENWYMPKFQVQDKILVHERAVKISLDWDKLEYLKGHCIDGRVLYPATGYLVLVWETFALEHGILDSEMSVVFENVYFHRATTIPKDGNIVELIITIHKKSGNFEISENNVSAVTGRIYARKGVGKEFRVIPTSDESAEPQTGFMNTKDFYKELHLRGYEYKDLFRGVIGCNVDGTRGRLRWDNNWVTLLDTMLQPKIVTHDTRLLYVPTRIEKIAIDVDMHKELLSKSESPANKSFEFRLYPHVGVTRAGGVELRGLHVTAIAKKTPLGIAVYEKNEFIPNYSSNNMKMEDILRADIQLVFENISTYKFKCIELVDEEYDKNGLEPVIEKVGDVLADLPLVQAELIVISEKERQMPSNITVENKKVAGELNTIVFIGANLCSRPNVLQDGFSTLKDQCFVISREVLSPEPKNFSNVYDIVTIHQTVSEYLVLLRKKVITNPTKYVKIITADQTFAWIDKIKELIKDAQKLVLYSQDESINGLLGLVNCLRKEPGGEIVSGLLIDDPAAPEFDPELKFYKEQLSKGLTWNVFKNGKWGTYRHLLLEELESVSSPHAYVNTTNTGDLSSLRWLQGSLAHDYVPTNPDQQLIHVYCTALNFRDVMTAMGRVTLDAVARGRIAQDCVQGIEISGRTVNGSRVMAVAQKAISNLVLTEASLMWPIPDEWTFEQAATVPVAYCTVYMAMVMIGKVRRGESILIHAGSGGVGQAAINVALHYGLQVFTTVGTPAKREIIKQLFPQLKDSHIGNSRDTSFVDMIQRETNGRGVHVVLNSLADDKLLASVACLTRRGRFLEIGKYDITNNTLIETSFLKKEISFHGVMLDYISDACTFKLRKTLHQLMLSGIMSGAVRPLTNCTFEKNNIEAAYRYMAAGKHIGKVIIKIRDAEPSGKLVKPSPLYIDALHRYTCNAENVYVLVGGLGGFGLELVDWLVLRGARKVVLTSRKGLSNGYQALRLRIWTSYGTDVKISTHDVTTESGCEETLKLANSMGPVTAIFNLAVILKDAVFQNQTPETFKTSFGPKSLATIHLDQLSRKLCPKLKDFVIFSSVSCGRGNAGQTNYGFSNSVMERICEERKKAGLPALAIQWGAIGDVGLVADMQEENIQLEIGGTLQQRIVSCLQAMDKFLIQDKATIVSSIVVAEKRIGQSEGGTSAEAIANIMDIKDLKTVSHQAALAELGMDSIMAVEVKQTLERDFEIFLSAQEIRTLTFGKLIEYDVAKASDGDIPTTRQTGSFALAGLEVFMRNFGDEQSAAEPFIYKPSRINNGTDDESTQNASPIIFLLPGLESCASALEILCNKLNARTCVLQLGINSKCDTLERMTNRLFTTVKSKLPIGASFYLLGYSFGSMPMLNLAAKLESEGHKGLVICVDGSPDFLFAMASALLQFNEEDSVLKNALMQRSLSLLVKDNNLVNSIMEEVNKYDTLDEKTSCANKLVPVDLDYSSAFLGAIANAAYDRLKVVIQKSEHKLKILKSKIVLLRPKVLPLNIILEEDYGLHKFSEHNVKVHYLDADHISIVETEECANIVNKILAEPRDEQTDKTGINVFTNMIEKTSRTVEG